VQFHVSENFSETAWQTINCR